MSTTYEQAPACKLLATHCACCGRPLLDAESVERGVGPDCARKYGYANASAPADWEAARHHVNPDMVDGFGEDAHRAANVLVHFIACNPSPRPHAIAAVWHLGYRTLAEKLADRTGACARVSDDGERYTVETAYSEETVAAMRRVPGRRWDGERKLNTFPRSSRVQLWETLRSALRGSLLITAKGLVIL